MNPEKIKEKIAAFSGDEKSPGTLRRQALDLSIEFGDYGLAVGIGRVADGSFMPAAVGYKYQKFFTHWAVSALTRLADSHRDSAGITPFLNTLRGLRDQGEMRRDRWIERIVGVSRWRRVRDIEERESEERLTAGGGWPIWTSIGPGERAAMQNETYNRLTGRERGSDGPKDDMEDWVFDSCEQPLKHPSMKKVREWRNTTISHQDLKQTRLGVAAYDVFPHQPLVRAYWAVMKSTHRVLLLAEGSGLLNLYPTPQFDIMEELSGGDLEAIHASALNECLHRHSVRWDSLLQKSERQWCRKLREHRCSENVEGTKCKDK